jgi:hypothetical protein
MCRAGGRGGGAEGELTVRVRIHTTITLHTGVTYWEEKDIMTEKVAKK